MLITYGGLTVTFGGQDVEFGAPEIIAAGPSLDSGSFDTGSFGVDSFDFGDIPPPLHYVGEDQQQSWTTAPFTWPDPVDPRDVVITQTAQYRTASMGELMRRVDPKPERITEYRFSNGRTFTKPDTTNRVG